MSGPRKPKPEPKSVSDSWMMRRFLQEIVNGSSGHGPVALGQLPGFPAMTSDPDVVQRAAQVFADRAEITRSLLASLRFRQRVIDLREAEQRLRMDAEPSEARQWFIEHGARWCRENGISYAALRETGVAPAILNQAGIGRQ